MSSKILKWIRQNAVAISLSILFIIVYVIKEINPQVNDLLGSCSLKFMNGEYYRWITSSSLHYGLYHLFGNVIGLLAVGSLISPFIGKWKTLFFFYASDLCAGITFSWIVSSPEPNYGGGASGGIFALIATLIVCYLRFPEEFKCKWYRADVLAVIVYFFIANDNWSSVLTHMFGFSYGIVLSFIFIVFNLIKKTNSKIDNKLYNSVNSNLSNKT
jgi:membrane associated rhomboid family serine protease